MFFQSITLRHAEIMVTYSNYYSIQFSLNVIANLLTFIMIIEVDKCVYSQMLHEDQFCGIGKKFCPRYTLPPLLSFHCKAP